MNYRLFLILLMIGIGGWLVYEKSLTKGPMQLINLKTGFVLVEFEAAQTRIYDPFLKQEMEKRGVLIPPFLKKSFPGASHIRLGEREFKRAFIEIYYELHLNHEIYQWRRAPPGLSKSVSKEME